MRHDGDDPYLVVAADKGTATFSDIANAVSAEHGYWLGDAFASGGSVGYDHKAMGITAKGAWESVKRHFRALGRDCQTQDFTCVGIGDMSGDVFGNGMLLSKHIRLLAAFDHRHIFLDPESGRGHARSPSASACSSCRARRGPTTTPALISQGRRRVSAHRRSRSRCRPKSRAALGIDADVDAMTPDRADERDPQGAGRPALERRHRHLRQGRAPRRNADVGDRANNAMRVNGSELRCKVVGEGGNLGMTQRGRIEAALHGVLLNTDFIDNSAGVDTSDHEVNIKILLNDAVQRGELTHRRRATRCSPSMTDEVAAAGAQRQLPPEPGDQPDGAHVASRAWAPSSTSSARWNRRGCSTARSSSCRRDAELAERKARGQGLTRPELAVLLSYAKIVAFQQLLDSDVPEDPYLSKELVRYFPEPLQEKYAKAHGAPPPASARSSPPR